MGKKKKKKNHTQPNQILTVLMQSTAFAEVSRTPVGFNSLFKTAVQTSVLSVKWSKLWNDAKDLLW